MSAVDTSTWNPDADLNVEIEGIPLNADAGIAQTWQAFRILMAAVKGDGDAIKLTINQPDGTTIVATNRTLTVVDNGHAHTIANVTGLQTALDSKAADNAVMHLSGAEIITGAKTFSSVIIGSVSGDAGTVNGHAVASDVPADAVFTDTTYADATVAESGLMSAADKTAFDTAASRGQIGGGSALADTIDLNTVVNPGCYTVRGLTAVNKPENSGATLVVWTSRNSQVNQLWLGNGNRIFRRNGSGSAWSSWRCIVEADAPPSSSASSYVLCGDGVWRKPADIS